MRPLILGLLLLVVACSSASPRPSSSVALDSSVPLGVMECEGTDVRTPSGERLALTGIWWSNGVGVYNIHQRGPCVNWLGMSRHYGQEPGTEWTNVFSGTLRSDFTIGGRWADVPIDPASTNDDLSFGTLTLRIDFEESDGVERPVLRVVTKTSLIGEGLEGSTWVLEQSLPTAIELEGAFGGEVETGCVWVESNGERYELVGNGGWPILGTPTVRIEDGYGHVVAQVGDLVRIRGRVSDALGDCAETAMWVEELDPTP
jgi:hypothetical protein